MKKWEQWKWREAQRVSGHAGDYLRAGSDPHSSLESILGALRPLLQFLIFPAFDGFRSWELWEKQSIDDMDRYVCISHHWLRDHDLDVLGTLMRKINRKVRREGRCRTLDLPTIESHWFIVPRRQAERFLGGLEKVLNRNAFPKMLARCDATLYELAFPWQSGNRFVWATDNCKELKPLAGILQEFIQFTDSTTPRRLTTALKLTRPIVSD